MALENAFYFNFKVLSRLPNRNKERKLMKFAVFDIVFDMLFLYTLYVYTKPKYKLLYLYSVKPQN